MRREVKYGLIGGSVALVAGVVGGFTLFGGSDDSPQEVRSADGPRSALSAPESWFS